MFRQPEIYALKNPNMLPNPDNTCIKCGSKIIQRSEDTQATVISRLYNFNEIYVPIITKLLSNTNKGINFVPGENNDIELVVNLLSSYIILSEKKNFKIIVQLFG